MQVFFVGYFAAREIEVRVRVRPGLRVQVAPGRYRVPDVTLLARDAPRQAVPDVPPVLCIEILSEDDRASELVEKIADYVAMGVKAIWVVDPRTRALFRADSDGMHPAKMLVLSGTAVRLTSAQIFAELDEMDRQT